MNRKEAKEYIEAHATELLQKDRSGKGYICPICGSGSGSSGTGITSKDEGKHFTCWTGCYSNADIFDIIGQQYGLTAFSDKLDKAAALMGIAIDRGTQSHIHNTQRTTATPVNAPEEEDYSSFFLEAEKHITETDYHRGLSAATLSRFHIGYVPDWRHPKAQKAPTSPRLIIPTSKHSYLARDTRNNLPPEQKKYSKQKVGKVRLFNAAAIKAADKPVFIVEGEIDALSIEEVGGNAVALGSVSNRRILLDLLRKDKPALPLILALDNDEAGQKAYEELATGLEQQGVYFYKADIASTYKDANEALMENRAAFEKAIEETTLKIFEQAKAKEEEEKAALKRESIYYHLTDFQDSIENSKRASFFSTGFPSVDRILDGGLYAGLYVVGAISSLGKTTFCLQIADQVAEQGQDVLIFSLEMATAELMAKSISRFTYTLNKQRNGLQGNAKTTRGILTGSRYARYTPEEKNLIEEAIGYYGMKCGEHIYIVEGMGNVGIEEIRERVVRHIRITGKAPVVLIDYLQIIAPEEIRSTDKQNTDKAVLELKRMSRDYSIPVIGISSFNRENYTAPVNLASFKESGAIEYSSDVLIGLQYEGMDYQEGETDGARQKRIRQLQKDMAAQGSSGEALPIQVKILKNRNGGKGEARLSFYPMFNYFREPEKATSDNSWKSVKGK